MPHQCTSCDETYPDGSQSVLSGCECGGTTFQYLPTAPDKQSHEPHDDTEVSQSKPLGGGIIKAGTDDTQRPEDASQADARSTIIAPSDIPDIPDAEHPETPVQNSTSTAPEPNLGLEALRQELNRQFEGIHIVAPGKYELNLMELFRRDECIITLRDDGKYDIGLPTDEFSLEDPE